MFFLTLKQIFIELLLISINIFSDNIIYIILKNPNSYFHELKKKDFIDNIKEVRSVRYGNVAPVWMHLSNGLLQDGLNNADAEIRKLIEFHFTFYKEQNILYF